MLVTSPSLVESSRVDIGRKLDPVTPDVDSTVMTTPPVPSVDITPVSFAKSLLVELINGNGGMGEARTAPVLVAMIEDKTPVFMPENGGIDMTEVLLAITEADPEDIVSLFMVSNTDPETVLDGKVPDTVELLNGTDEEESRSALVLGIDIPEAVERVTSHVVDMVEEFPYGGTVGSAEETIPVTIGGDVPRTKDDVGKLVLSEVLVDVERTSTLRELIPVVEETTYVDVFAMLVVDEIKRLGRLLKMDVDDGRTDDDAEGGEQAPAIDGTALIPCPIGTRLVPQFAAQARCRFWLS
jgi:hypothetical protein